VFLHVEQSDGTFLPMCALRDHHQDNDIDENNIHFMHLINIGHAPLFHIIFSMEILVLVSIYIISYKNRGIKNLLVC
jgi:hypothetical protein